MPLRFSYHRNSIVGLCGRGTGARFPKGSIDSYVVWVAGGEKRRKRGSCEGKLRTGTGNTRRRLELVSRVNKEVFLKILEEIAPKLPPGIRSTHLPAPTKLARYLAFVATGISGKDKEYSKFMSRAKCPEQCVKLTMHSVEHHAKWLTLDQSEENELLSKQNFQNICGLPVGVLQIAPSIIQKTILIMIVMPNTYEECEESRTIREELAHQTFVAHTTPVSLPESVKENSSNKICGLLLLF
ncbi:hypothetical protein EVAR_70156_1 [Eumeta japonica]|uniref:Uncharacterized protein n=1 Tax=Eumeta variegata TaxID=151549 RepID=A0A4C1SCH8_EUMVA|nr:hypothetical protein EVAR_70156_1 [Eumeta japonica]